MFDGIITKFRNSLDLLDEEANVQKLCTDFLKGMAAEGGPARIAATKLGKEWKNKLKERFGITIQFD